MSAPEPEETDFDDVLSSAGLAPTRLHEAVVERFTRAILDGRLKPGDALPSEARIASAFGVSKQVAREAVRDLAAMGVVHVQQGKATRVRALDSEPLGRFFRFAVRGSREGLAEAVELRRILEPPAARFAAIRRSKEEVAALEKTLRRLETEMRNIPVWIEADLDFHETVAAMSGNRLLRLHMRGLRPVIREIMELFNARRERARSEWRATYDRHARVFEAIASGDGEAAQTAMADHFSAADEAVQELFPAASERGPALQKKAREEDS